jgi:hypothetical protein
LSDDCSEALSFSVILLLNVFLHIYFLYVKLLRVDLWACSIIVSDWVGGEDPGPARHPVTGKSCEPELRAFQSQNALDRPAGAVRDFLEQARLMQTHELAHIHCCSLDLMLIKYIAR